MNHFAIGVLGRRSILAALSLGAMVLVPTLTIAKDGTAGRNDLRDLRVGMRAAEISVGGYTNLRCVDQPEKALSSWSDYGQCKSDAQGRHNIHFEFDEKTNVLGPLDDKYRGTMVGGHPVILTLQIDDQAKVSGLDITTDNNTRMYLRKKAHMLGRQAMSFYGSDGWSCDKLRPADDEAPIGGLFIRERCAKLADGREIIIHRDFYRPVDAQLKEFVSATKIEVHSTQ